jgi:hypothetical protein
MHRTTTNGRTHWQISRSILGLRGLAVASLFALAPAGVILGSSSAGASTGQAITAETSASSPHLAAISCASPSFCKAVGTYKLDGAKAGFTETWNGARWKASTMPESSLSSISCPTTTMCMAVGSNPSAEEWTNGSWRTLSVTPPSGTTSATLFDVSCSRPTSCMAVGDNLLRQTFIEHWDGTSWSLQFQLDEDNAGLNSVSCPSAKSCFAVGGGNSVSGAPGTIAMHWNGTSWSSAPKASFGVNASLAAISCPSTTFCLAVGASDILELFNNPGVIEELRHGTWHESTVPSGNGNVLLSDVTCASARFCAWIERQGGTTPYSAIVFSGRGRPAATGRTPNAADVTGLVCPTKNDCIAVYGTKAWRWTGTKWHKTALPKPHGS